MLNAFNDVVPVAIVLIGNFLSCRVPSHTYAEELKSHLTQLGHYLHDTTPKLCKHTTFVLLSGPGDRYCGAAGASIFPRYFFFYINYVCSKNVYRYTLYILWHLIIFYIYIVRVFAV